MDCASDDDIGAQAASVNEPATHACSGELLKMTARFAVGIYRDRWGLSATVKVHGRQREKRFSANASIRSARAWRDEMRAGHRRRRQGVNGWQYPLAAPLRRVATRREVVERNGAGDGGRTRDLQLGKLTLYH